MTSSNIDTTEDPRQDPRHRKKMVSFVRRGDRITASQETAWQKYSEDFLVEIEREETDTSVALGQTLDAETVFGNDSPLVVEIGIGKGEAVVHAANSTPNKNFLGVEVYRAGLAKTMMEAGALGVKNLRVVSANAPEVLQKFLPEESVAEVRIFFPDPWHKQKHNKRRLINSEFCDLLDRVLLPGGVVRMATDWQHYANQMKSVFEGHDSFEASFDGDWAERFEGRPLTNFEAKGIKAGRVIRDLTYAKRSAN